MIRPYSKPFSWRFHYPCILLTYRIILLLIYSYSFVICLPQVENAEITVPEETITDGLFIIEQSIATVTGVVIFDCNTEVCHQELGHAITKCYESTKGIDCFCTAYDSYGICRSTTNEGCGDPSDLTTLHNECTAYSITAESLCEQCFKSEAAALSCLDENDVDCLCPTSVPYISSVESCVRDNNEGPITCPSASLRQYKNNFSDNCTAYLTEREYDGCLKCQASIATEVGCSGREDYRCLCSVKDYMSSISRCIATDCFPGDQTIARNSITAACQLVSLEPTSATGSGDISLATENGEDEGGEDAPETATVVGIVVGAVAALSFLLIGGYYIFRKHSEKEVSGKSKRAILLPWSKAIIATPVGSTAELPASGQGGAHEVCASPLGASDTGFRELNGEPRRQLHDTVFEMGSQRSPLPSGSVEHNVSEPEQEPVELGPSK